MKNNTKPLCELADALINAARSFFDAVCVALMIDKVADGISHAMEKRK